MKSLLTQALVIAVASIAIAGVLRSMRSDPQTVATPLRWQEPSDTINLSRNSPLIQSVSAQSGPPINIDDEEELGQNSLEGGSVDATGTQRSRIREGKRVKDPSAVFQIVGERIHCNLQKHGLSVIALENLTLERVHHYLLRGSATPTWEVEGVITEYEGANYIELKRAIVNSLELDE